MHLDGLRVRRHVRRRLRPGLPGAGGLRLGGPLHGVGPGVLGHVRHLAVGERGAEAGVAPADGGGRGHRLLRPDRAGPRLRPGGRCAPAPAATAPTGCSTAARCGSPTGPSPTSRSCGRRPTTASAASWSPRTTPGFSAPEIKHKMSLRASVTSELVLDGVRLPGLGGAPGRAGTQGTAVLSQRGPLRHRLGLPWVPRGPPSRRALSYAGRARAVRQADRRVPAHAGQARRHDPGAGQGRAARAAPGPPQGRRPAAPGAGEPRQAEQRARGARDLPDQLAPSSARTASRWSTP